MGLRLKYEHLSPEAIQAAKLFWFDSIGCALGGSQQDDAKILLKHHRAMAVRHQDSIGCALGGSQQDDAKILLEASPHADGRRQRQEPPHSFPASRPIRSMQHF